MKVLALSTLLLIFMSRLVSQPSDRAFERVSPPYLKPEPIREADVFWEKRLWRSIDFRQKINMHFAHPESSLPALLTEAVLSGELQAFSALADDFSLPIAARELKNKLFPTDTIPVMDLESGEITDYEVVQSEPDYGSYYKLLLKEDWIFDEETSSMKVRIIGMAPVRMYRNPVTGELLGDETLFWVYYPDAVPYLAGSKAFNQYNQAMSLSWYDIFEMRYFQARVIKESNVYDRAIADYASGIDAVLESERIKEELFSFENMLWEY